MIYDTYMITRKTHQSMFRPQKLLFRNTLDLEHNPVETINKKNKNLKACRNIHTVKTFQSFSAGMSTGSKFNVTVKRIKELHCL